MRLILDGTVVKARIDRKATAISVLAAIGVRRDGQKVLLAIRNMGGESRRPGERSSTTSTPAASRRRRSSLSMALRVSRRRWPSCGRMCRSSAARSIADLNPRRRMDADCEAVTSGMSGPHGRGLPQQPGLPLSFDRDAARGMRLDIPAGTAVRFEPGQRREVRLVPYAGDRRVPRMRQALFDNADSLGQRPAAPAPAVGDRKNLNLGYEAMAVHSFSLLIQRAHQRQTAFGGGIRSASITRFSNGVGFRGRRRGMALRA